MATPDLQPTQTVAPKSIIRSKRPKWRYLWICIGIVLIALIVGGVFFWQKTHDSEPYQPMTTAQYNQYQQAKAMAEQARTLDPVSRAVQLTGAASLMDRADQHKESLAYYLEAQKVVDENNLRKTAVLDYSEQIADEYAKLGDKTNARTYYKKAISFVKSQTDNPNQAELLKGITDKEKKL